MATYAEIFDLRSDSGLRNRVAVAVAIKAQGLIDGATPTAAQITWANSAISNPLSKADMLLNYILAKNNGLTLGQIANATDAAIQAQVNSAVDALIAGGA